MEEDLPSRSTRTTSTSSLHVLDLETGNLFRVSGFGTLIISKFSFGK